MRNSVHPPARDKKKRREGDTLYFEILVYRPASFLCIGRAVEAAQRAAGARPARRRRPMPAAPNFKGPVHLALYLIQGRWLGGSAEADPLKLLKPTVESCSVVCSIFSNIQKGKGP